MKLFLKREVLTIAGLALIVIVSVAGAYLNINLDAVSGAIAALTGLTGASSIACRSREAAKAAIDLYDALAVAKTAAAADPGSLDHAKIAEAATIREVKSLLTRKDQVDAPSA